MHNLGQLRNISTEGCGSYRSTTPVPPTPLSCVQPPPTPPPPPPTPPLLHKPLAVSCLPGLAGRTCLPWRPAVSVLPDAASSIHTPHAAEPRKSQLQPIDGSAGYKSGMLQPVSATAASAGEAAQGYRHGCASCCAHASAACRVASLPSHNWCVTPPALHQCVTIFCVTLHERCDFFA